jgi:DTW domain-containing protein YfiP
VRSRTEVVLVRHHLERHKTTNTGRLAALALERAHLHDFFARGAPLEPPLRWESQRQAVLLYPREDATSLSAWVGRGPLTLFVLDGPWIQTRKMARAVAPLPDLPAVTLPPEARPRFVLRRDEHEGRMMTLDALAQALEILEGEEVAAPLHRLYRDLVERTLASRGTPLPGGRTWRDFVQEAQHG